MQQLGELVAHRGEAVVEQGDVVLLALQPPALVAELQLDPIGGQRAGLQLRAMQQPELKQLQQGVVGQSVFAKAEAGCLGATQQGGPLVQPQQQPLLVAAGIVAGQRADALKQLGLALGHLFEGGERPNGEAAGRGDFQREDPPPQLLHRHHADIFRQLQKAGQPVAVHLAASRGLFAVAGGHHHDGFQIALAGGLIRQMAKGGALFEGAVGVAGEHAVDAATAGQTQGLLLAAQDRTLFFRGGEVCHADSIRTGSGAECYSNRDAKITKRPPWRPLFLQREDYSS